MKWSDRLVSRRARLMWDEFLQLLHSGQHSPVDAAQRPAQYCTLERRVMMSATPVAIVADAAITEAPDALSSGVLEASAQEADAVPTEETILIHGTATEQLEATEPAEAVPLKLAFVDESVDDAAALQELLQSALGPDAVVISIAENEDGLQKITDTLRSYQDVGEIHLFSHGDAERIYLGNSVLSSETLRDHAGQLRQWMPSLTVDADILIYGCDVAATDSGKALLREISGLTGADVAASDDVTGNAQSGGDWDLETVYGEVNLPDAEFVESVAEYSGVFAAGDVINVTTTDDVLDAPDLSSVAALLADAGADGFISLREAVIATNNDFGEEEIVLAAGTYTRSLSGSDDQGLTGDLDIQDDLIIRGAGALNTIIDANGMQRGIEIHPGANVSLFDLTITGGDTTEHGGGISVLNSGALIADSIRLVGNTADKRGGGINIKNNAIVDITNSVIAGNAALTEDGGGINAEASVTLNKVQISGNTARDGGGIYAKGGGTVVTGEQVTISGNSASQFGGGVYANKTVELTFSTVANNQAASGGGGLYLKALDVTLTNTLLAGNTNSTTSASENVGMGGGTLLSGGFNLSTDGTASLTANGDLVNADADLQPLTNVGGLLEVHTLGANSLAIDAGSTELVPAADASGTLRNDGIADIGASESTATSSGALFFTDSASGKIMRSKADGSGRQVIVSGADAGTPEMLAVDPVGERIYWVDSGSAQIKSARLDGSDVQTPLSSGVLGAGALTTVPTALEVDSANDHLFVTTSDATLGVSEVLRFDLDGSNRTVIATAEEAVDIAVDAGRNRLYWLEADPTNGQRVRMSALDGSGVATLMTGVVSPRGISIDRTANVLYFTVDPSGTSTDGLYRYFLDTDTGEFLTGVTLNGPWGVESSPEISTTYWVDSGSGNLVSVPATGGTATLVASGFTGLRDVEYAQFGAAATNQPPVADAGGPYTITAGDSLTLDASGTTDPNGGALTYEWDLNADGTYNDASGVAPTVPWADLEALGLGTHTLRLRVTDPGGESAPATATLTIENRLPVAGNDGGSLQFTTDQDTVFNLPDVLTNDTDSPDDTLTVVSFDTSATSGILTEVSNGVFRYDPNGAFDYLRAGQSATDTFTYTIEDSQGAQSTATVTVTVEGIDDPPVAVTDPVTIAKNVSTTFNPTVNDTDPESDTITLLDVGRAAHGSTLVGANNTVVYTPNNNYEGNDSFEYRITDGTDGLQHYWGLDGNGVDTVGSAHGTLVNGPPTIAGEFGQALGFNEVNQYVEVPDVNYGTDFTLSFDFRLDDNSGTEFQYLYSHGTPAGPQAIHVYISEAGRTISPANQLRTFVRDGNDTVSYYSLAFDVSSLVGDGQWHTYTLSVSSTGGSRTYLDGVLQRTDASRGTDGIDPTGNLFLGARSDLDGARFSGVPMDSVQLFNRELTAAEITSGSTQLTAVGTVNLTVVNTAPTAAAGGPYTIAEGGVVSLDASGSTDSNGDTLSYSWDLDNDGVFGDATGVNPTVSYADLGSPAPGAHTVSVRVSDGQAAPQEASASVTVTNVAPTAADDSGTGFETDENTAFQTGSVLTNDSDPGGVVSVTGLDTTGTLGTVTNNGDGTFQYDPGNAFRALAEGASATDSFTYEISDPQGAKSTAVVTIQVAGINQPPTGISLSSTLIPGRVAGAVIGNVTVTDPDTGDTHTLSVDDTRFEIVGGQLRLKAGELIDETVESSVAVEIRAEDTFGGILPLNFTLTVANSNTPPVAADDTYQVREDSTLTVSAADDWHLTEWQTRYRVTVDAASLAAVPASGPILLRLTPAEFDYSAVGESGHDLRFTDSPGNILSHEIAHWDSTGESRIWVRANTLTAGTASELHLYGGNPAAPDGQNAAAVWGNEAAGVFHFDADWSDSSGNAGNGIPAGASLQPGLTGNAASFDGVDDAVSLGSAAELDDVFAGGGTVSAWIRAQSAGESNFGSILIKADSTFSGGQNGNGWGLQLNGTNRVYFEVGGETATYAWRTQDPAIAYDTWHHVALSYDSDTPGVAPEIYVDGVLVSLTVDKTGGGNYRSDAALDLTVGNRSTATDRTFDGEIDEVRVYSSRQSAAEVALQARQGSSDLATLGAMESGPGSLLSNDTDAENDALTAQLVSGPAHAASFNLNADGSFTYQPDADYFGTDQFTYTVSDAAGAGSTATVTLNVLAQNDAPGLQLTPAAVSLTEGTEATSRFLSNVQITDDGTGVNDVTLSGADAGLFELQNGNTEVHLKAGIPLDYQTRQQYQVTVTVTDAALPPAAAAAQTLTVNVTDTNDNPPVVTPGQAYSVSETAADGTRIAILTATDADTVGSLSDWRIVGGNADGAFAINATTGELTVADTTLIDAETRTSVTLQVDVFDGVNRSTVTDVIVQITDDNDTAPVVTPGLIFTVSEAAPDGSAVGTVTATDADTVGSLSDWRIVGGNADGAFAINATTGEVTVADTTLIDAETRSSVTLQIDVSDGVNRSAARDVVVNIGNVNDTPPVVTPGQVFTVTENSAGGTLVGTPVATDADGAPTAFSDWKIVGGTGAGNFAIDPGTGQLRVNGALDYEQATAYSLQLTVSDGVNTSAAAEVSVHITDVNEAPQLTLVEHVAQRSEHVNTAGGLLFARVSVNDDALGTNVLNLAGPDAGIFEISAGTIRIRDGVAFDYEQQSVYRVTVEVRDSSISTAALDSLPLELTIVDRNDPPVLTPLNRSISITEDTGTAATTVAALLNAQVSDQDAGTEIGMAVTSFSGNGTWQYSTDTGRTWSALPAIGTGQALLLSGDTQLRYRGDGQNGEEALLTYRAVDGTSGTDAVLGTVVSAADYPLGRRSPFSTDTDTIRVIVADVADAPESKPIDAIQFAEDAPAASFRLGDYFTDVDNGDTLEFSLAVVSQPAGLLDVVTLTPGTGSFTVESAANAYGRAAFRITAKDLTGLTVSEIVEVEVTPVNDAPTSVDHQLKAQTGLAEVVGRPGLLTDATDIEGDALTVVIVTKPSYGKLVQDGTGRYIYTADAGYVGTDFFQYAAFDGTDRGNVSTVEILVEPLPVVASTDSGESGDSESPANESVSEGDDSQTQSTGNISDGAVGNGGDYDGEESEGTEWAPHSRDGVDDEQEFIANPKTRTVDVSIGIEGITTDVNIGGRLRFDIQKGDAADESVADSLRSLNAAGFGSGYSSSRSSREVALYARMGEDGALWKQLDDVDDQLGGSAGLTTRVVGSVGVITSGLSVGYIVWAVRGGMLLSGLLAQMPAWSMVDPLMVIDGVGSDESDDESIESIVSSQDGTEEPEVEKESLPDPA